MDYLHLGQCKVGYEYIQEVIDHFSKFAQTFPTKTKSCRAAADSPYSTFLISAFASQYFMTIKKNLKANFFKVYPK